MVCLGNLCIVWFLPRRSGCSEKVVLAATVITLPFEITVERRASTHELAAEI